MNSRRFPSPRKPLWKLRFTTQTPSLTLARPKIRLARIEPTKPAGAGVVVRVLKFKNRLFKTRFRLASDLNSRHLLTFLMLVSHRSWENGCWLRCLPRQLTTVQNC
ncbi:hypothetical protein AVEN_209994-1 [Araneus ventricosus]|uniref:Uncharacterized protein n=1 Tax=Araneus ventricosus TaxID=182803 RepID=A0A4Y2HFF9_ARAVE|nr:hypothetical protein AVEN_3133-1 [Araneus ventricosus]GBM64085.1 hypothetical protein AVEN_63337-1 [Araneus ventricosus]GBM64094.1 hypothetical protein AVEN_70163-1 [Araneus ventricosus]GBM64100.1 hypothetical protein AVEN_209994-1 [Araneus ventricosus]